MYDLFLKRLTTTLLKIALNKRQSTSCHCGLRVMNRLKVLVGRRRLSQLNLGVSSQKVGDLGPTWPTAVRSRSLVEILLKDADRYAVLSMQHKRHFKIMDLTLNGFDFTCCLCWSLFKRFRISAGN